MSRATWKTVPESRRCYLLLLKGLVVGHSYSELGATDWLHFHGSGDEAELRWVELRSIYDSGYDLLNPEGHYVVIRPQVGFHRRYTGVSNAIDHTPTEDEP